MVIETWYIYPTENGDDVVCVARDENKHNRSVCIRTNDNNHESIKERAQKSLNNH